MLLGQEVSEEEIPPFDAAIAHDLYRALFGQIEDLIKDKSLLIVPSGALTQLPFEVLVTTLPSNFPFGERLREIGVLGAELKDLTPGERQSLKLPAGPGVKIVKPIADGAAEAAGLKPDDILLSIDGEDYASVPKVIGAIQSRTPGSRIELRLLRSGEEFTITATLGGKTLHEWVPHFLAAEEGKEVSWLGQRQAITILPSVASLKALRTARESTARNPFLGFGNPLLDGLDGNDKSAWAKQSCQKSSVAGRRRTANRASLATIFRAGQADLDGLRHQPPLPETADELCQVAGALGVPEAKLGNVVYLGQRATVKRDSSAIGKRRAWQGPRYSFRYARPACGRDRFLCEQQGRACTRSHAPGRGSDD